jgi:hypothetical protein
MKNPIGAVGVIGMLLALAACGTTPGPQRVVVATGTPIPAVAPTEAPSPPRRGVAPVEEAGSGTACPDGYPIKADDATMLYYRPDQQSYDATNTRHCFVSEATAQTAGYRNSER